MSRLASKLRALSLAAALAVPLAGVRGLCFMSFEAPGTAPSRHECCRSGLKLARPNCCTAVTWEQAPARAVARSSLEMAAAAFVWSIAPIGSTATRPASPTHPGPHVHDPPEHIVLRV